jgi:endonuclease/exonuclease/phosphatase family metal-dependent hydrolase
MAMQFRNFLLLFLGLGSGFGFSFGFSVFAEPPNQPARPSTLRVATFNLLHDWPRHHLLMERLELVAEEARARHIDVLILQEAAEVRHKFHGSTAGILAEKLGFDHYFKPTSGASTYWLTGFRTGQAVLSRYPLTDGKVLFFRKQKKVPISEGRSIVKATVRVQEREIDIYSIHVSTSPEFSISQLQESLDWIDRESAGKSVLMAGDFNLKPVEFPLDALLFRALGFTDIFHITGEAFHTCCVCIQKGYYNSSDTCPVGQAEPEKRIDYFFFRREGVPAENLKPTVTGPFMGEPKVIGDEGPVYGSDHTGIFTEFEL